jgi:hypothetical protein
MNTRPHPVPNRLAGPAQKSDATGKQTPAAQANPFAPYWRLHDPLCRKFLEQAADPQEFDGLKLLFPFVRELSLLRVWQRYDNLGGIVCLAFLAGHDLGRAHPELAEAVLPDAEAREALRRLGVIQFCSQEEHLTHAGLRRACARIVAHQWSKAPRTGAERVWLEAVLKTLRIGFAAGSLAQFDPTRCEFVGDIPPRTHDGLRDILARHVVAAPLEACGKAVSTQLEHPLLRIARQLYPAQPGECDAVLGFLRQRLERLGVTSEDECPATELELADWIADGMEYGRRFVAEHPAKLAAIFAECAGDRLQASRSVVRRVVHAAGGTEPVRLLGHLKQWQQDLYGWCDARFYGEELARAAYFSDFAVWIPWVVKARKPRTTRKRAPQTGSETSGTTTE